MKTVWLVTAGEYGRIGSSVVHVCETKEIAQSYVEYEHTIDYAGPIYKIKEIEVKRELAEIPEDLW